MAGSFSSMWKGSEIDSAISVIRNSGVSSAELSVLKSVTPGIVDASKSLVVDSSKNLGVINILEANIYKGGLFQLPERTTDPTNNPTTGYKYLYLKNGEPYTKSSDGTVTRIGGGKEKEFSFTDQTSITCVHGYGKKYVAVDIIGIDDKPLTGQILYQNTTTTLVSFNHAQSGTVIIRTV